MGSSIHHRNRLARLVQKVIGEKNMEPRTKLSSQESLVRRFGISRPTISNAINLLIKEIASVWG